MRGTLTALGMALTLAFAAPATAQSSAAFDYDTSGVDIADPAIQGFDPVYTLGYSFTLSRPTTVTALGYWNGGSAGSQPVSIWNLAGDELASTVVSITPPEGTRYSYTDLLTPLVLAANVEYVIGGRIDGGSLFPVNLMGYVPAPGFTATGFRERIGSFGFPAAQTGFDGPNDVALVNFLFVSPVPEPATWAMMLLGFGGVGMVIRRRRKTLGLAQPA